MSVLQVLTFPHPVLREKCAEVKDITDDVRKLLSDMAETMYEYHGIGLAAPQVGSTLRLIVVDIGEDEDTGRKPRLYKIVNPVVTKRQGVIASEEGCLCFPGVREVIKRAERITVEGLDENSEELIIEAEGLLAFCLQHEIDHLNGILIIDHLSRLRRELIKARMKKSRHNSAGERGAEG